MATQASVAAAHQKAVRRKKELEKELEVFFKKFPYGETHEEQKKAYENLVKLVFSQQEQINALSRNRTRTF